MAYDDVANDQRKVVYAQRNELMEANDISDIITEIRKDVVNNLITQYIPPKTMEEQWDITGLEDHLYQEFNAEIPIRKMLDQDKRMQEVELRQRIIDLLGQLYRQKEEQMTTEVARHFEKSVMLQMLDNSWKEHLSAMDYLRKGIHLRGYAQKDPKQEYKREAFEMFTSLLDHIKYEVTRILFRVQVRQEEDVQAMDEQMQAPREMHFEHAEASALGEYEAVDEAPPQQAPAPPPVQPYIREGGKVGRNDPCPCGSGKKYKQCHGKLN